ncbi:hypothetical protein EYF80_022742 [Liparis tanakae]|uniref:Uncharacterized protein n=1 Tax=Liparis tanakae TaxID=230148 RepID=A0A4Z2HM50_9TELE|nr:hypothetical protein EYF80_022742 [Liparis tanakae]
MERSRVWRDQHQEEEARDRGQGGSERAVYCTHPVPLHAHTHFLAAVRPALVLHRVRVVTGHVTRGPHLLPGAHGGLLQSFGRLELALPLVEGAKVLQGGGHRGAEEEEEEEHLRRRTTQEEEEEEEEEGEEEREEEHLRRRTTQEEEEEEKEGEGEEEREEKHLRKRTIKEKQEEEENFLFFRDVSISDPECSEALYQPPYSPKEEPSFCFP